jgi:hypothetical protein
MEQNDLNQTPMGDHSEESIKAESNLVSEQTIQSENQVESMPVSEVVDNIADTTFELQLEPEPEEEEISSTDLDSASGVPTMDVDVSYIDYSGLTKFELIQKFKQLLSEGEITYLRNEIENLKVNFYKKHKAENEERRKKFIEDGGVLEEYTAIEDVLEDEFKQLYKDYRERKTELSKSLDEQKAHNLKVKYEIIEHIKDLINKPESLQNTFEEFHHLQNKWKHTGLVPQKEMKELYDLYHFHVQGFYNWIKLNNEARDMDLRRNLEAKIELCEKVESLILETDIRKAFGELQIFHERWREIGPISPDKKEEIWVRFREATTKIHKIHQEYFLKKKDELEGNLNAKTILCEKAEEIASKVYTRFKEWETATDGFIELQQVWKTIGMVPKSENNRIFRRFKDASDRFFIAKKEFYSIIMEEENNNLQLKTDICLKAESLKESTDWKRTTEDLIRLQKDWKRIGPVSRRVSDKIWFRFRTACNEFFERKATHYSTIDGLLDENIKKKEDLLEKIETYQFTENSDEDLKNLKIFQKDWVEIGHVPENVKMAIQDRYRKAINKAFDSLQVDDKKKENIKFKMRIENIMQQQNSRDRLYMERENLVKKLNQIEAELKTLENNIGFFSKSKNSDSLLKDFSSKIEAGKKETAIIKEQVKYLDNIYKD